MTDAARLQLEHEDGLFNEGSEEEQQEEPEEEQEEEQEETPTKKKQKDKKKTICNDSKTSSNDGRLPESPLKQAVMDFLKIDHMNAFRARIHDSGLSRSERARLAPIILDLASAGDAVSISIVAEGVEALSNCVFSTSRQLYIKSPTILLAGGLLQHTYFSNSLEAALNTRIPSANITQPILSPGAGAVLMALKAINYEISDANIDKLKEASCS